MTDDKERSGASFLLRQPFALLGAVALLSLAQDLLQWQEMLRSWLDAFQAVTRPIWDFLLGWFFEWVGWKFPWWVKDYLTVGAIITGMYLRMVVVFRSELSFHSNDAIFLSLMPLWWPWGLYVAFRNTLKGREARRWARIFWETGIWALIIIAVNYALLYGGA